ncbi:hypothetical protein [Polaromonas sp.]|uniref:hypothetical protein n=1 Tax=Polaromonas sp. TaxID=1869339 RepID=UPI003267200A
MASTSAKTRADAVVKKTQETLLDPFTAEAEQHYNAAEQVLARVEPAWAKAALYFRTHEHFGHQPGTRRMQSLVRIHERLEVYRKRLASGDTMAILQAVHSCANENLPLPTWLAIAFSEGLKGFLSVGGAPSLDEVFKSPRLSTDTAKKAAIDRQDWQLGGTIWRDVWKIVRRDESILSVDAAFKAALAAEDYGVKKTKAKSLVAMVEKNQLEHLGHNNTLSRFLEKRRKAFPKS